MGRVRVGRLAAVGLFFVASCGGKTRDESRLSEPVAGDAGNKASTTEDDRSPITRGCPGATPFSAGIDLCSDGVYHRTGSAQCDVRIPQGELSPADQALLAQFLAEDGNLRRVECMSHSDCNERPLGYCSVNLADVTVANCSYNCQNDDDCEPGTACGCDGNGRSACVPTRCRSDDDCIPGFACLTPNSFGGVCEHPDDECRSDADCPAGRECNWCEEWSQCGRAGAACQGSPG